MVFFRYCCQSRIWTSSPFVPVCLCSHISFSLLLSVIPPCLYLYFYIYIFLFHKSLPFPLSFSPSLSLVMCLYIFSISSLYLLFIVCFSVSHKSFSVPHLPPLPLCLSLSISLFPDASLLNGVLSVFLSISLWVSFSPSLSLSVLFSLSLWTCYSWLGPPSMLVRYSIITWMSL